MDWELMSLASRSVRSLSDWEDASPQEEPLGDDARQPDQDAPAPGAEGAAADKETAFVDETTEAGAGTRLKIGRAAVSTERQRGFMQSPHVICSPAVLSLLCIKYTPA